MPTSDALQKALAKYEDKFGESFPSEQIHVPTDKELFMAINHCLDVGKPAKSLFNLKNDVIY